MAEKFNVVTFQENAAYTTEQAAAILQRSPKTVRFLCRRGSIRACVDRGGYLITGWALRAYLENRTFSNTDSAFVK
jgi:hypothetical protein